MITRASVAAAVTLFAIAVTASACDKKPAPPAPAPAPAPPPLPPSDAACKLVTQDEAGKLLGHPVGAGAIGTKPGPDAECHFKSDAPAGTVDVLLYTVGDDALRDTLKSAVLGKDPVQIPGIGTRAYRNDAGNALGLLAKGKFVYVTTTAGDPAGIQAFAQLLVTKL